jgi:hypothetical protein
MTPCNDMKIKTLHKINERKQIEHEHHDENHSENG